MIDTNAVEHTFAKPLHNPAVRRLKDMQALNAHTDQGINVEEATVAKLLIGSTPIGQPITLQIKYVVESVDVLVDCIDCPLNSCRYFGLFRRQALQKLVKNGFVTM